MDPPQKSIFQELSAQVENLYESQQCITDCLEQSQRLKRLKRLNQVGPYTW
ncbi:hypothetical protein [Legionella pneumophila]|uniref:hypothetical protein n=1 Tax=Legionella pneumophila TaxID=446 RepID=UPI000ACEC93B|nr:hypothetical protein [Legionella pneumophila]